MTNLVRGVLLGLVREEEKENEWEIWQERESEKERENKFKKKSNLLATYCNKLLKLFKFGNFDVARFYFLSYKIAF